MRAKANVHTMAATINKKVMSGTSLQAEGSIVLGPLGKLAGPLMGYRHRQGNALRRRRVKGTTGRIETTPQV